MNPKNSPLLRAIRGPIMLVTLGTLFVIDHAGGVGFFRTWPVLLIVLGLLRLGEYLGTKGAFSGNV